jgi:hypothetical protein
VARQNRLDRRKQRPAARPPGAESVDDVPEVAASAAGAFKTSLAVIVVCAAAGGLFGWWWNRPQHVQVTAPAHISPPQKPNVPTVELPSMPFQDVTQEAGITFVHENGATGNKLLPETMGGGVGVLDYDSDGDNDILFVNSKAWPEEANPDEPPATCALFANDGTGKFTDVSKETGLDVSLYGMGCAIGDYDNDGDPDVYISSVGANRLLRNDDGRFIDVTGDAGVAGPADAWGTSCGWFDYDNDGRLDLFVCNYVAWSREYDLAQNFRLRGTDTRAYGRPQNFGGTFPLLFHNDGDGKFSDVTEAAGLQIRDRNLNRPLAKSLGVTFVDLDADGDLDILVANDTVQNLLFENEGGGHFNEAGARSGLAFDAGGNARGAMGIDSATFRGGTSVGVAIGNFVNEMTAFYVTPKGEANFTDEAVASGVGPHTRLELTFGVLLADFDLDGRPDLFATNGHLEEDIHRVAPNQHYEQSPQLFWNCGEHQATEFCPLSEHEVGKDFFEPIVGRGAAFADFDADGDLDIIMTAAGRPARLLRNDLPAGRRWTRLKLVGHESNRDAIGATVTITADGQTQSKTVMPTRGYLSQSEQTLTFGFGTGKIPPKIENVEIVWPSGKKTILKDVPLGETTAIEEG